jgi:hypothetical protein
MGGGMSEELTSADFLARYGRQPQGFEEVDAATYQKIVAEQERKNKYRNVPVTIDGIWFQSQHEADRWAELKLMEAAGDIKYLRRQVTFKLEVNDLHVCDYIADFRYCDSYGTWHFEDAKGVRTPVYRIKKTLMKAILDIDIEEV